MSNTINRVILVGNTGSEVKFHRFDSENCIARFSVATTENYVNKSTGEKKTHTDWHTVVVKNKTAEYCEKNLLKGSRVYVEGKIKTRSWENEGILRYTTEIISERIEFWAFPKRDKNE